MDIDKKTARARWRDPEFQRIAKQRIDALMKEVVVLDGVDLAGVAIGVEGPINEFWNINLYKSRISNADMRFAQFGCSLSEAIIERTLFSGADFNKCLVRNAKIIYCDFAAAHLVVNLDDSMFERCNFSAARFAGGRAGLEYGGRRVKFIGCDFSGATFKGVEFRASRFIDCVFDGASFSSCDFRGVKVEGGIMPSASQFEKMDIPVWASK